jgi:DNA-binding response OmpR family regulator
MKLRILLVEDNTDMRESLKTFLAEEGATVSAVGSAEEAIDIVDEKNFDIGIVDINLPGKSGFSLVEYIRENGKTYPLIAMTARDSIIDKIKGFDLGLTDYVVKPFDLLELRARIFAHAKGQNTNLIKTQNFELRTSSFEFFMKDKKIEVTQLEMRILEILLRNNHVLVTLDDLIEFAWGEQSELTNPPVRIHIANLRKKIGDNDYRIIRTISGVGYILDDPIAGGSEK